MTSPTAPGTETGMETGETAPTTDSMETTGGPACDGTDQTVIDMCIQGAMAMDDYCPEVGDCNCMSCACELAACEADTGCTSIRECAQRTGCLGIECLEPENCMAEIDAAGGVTGPSGAIALMLSACVEASGCMTQCPGEGTGSEDTGTAETGTGTMG